MKRSIRTVGLLTLLAFTANASAITFENSSHQMSAGDFTGNGENEVAYIKSTGAAGPIFVHHFGPTGNSMTLPGVTATQVIAANIDGVGKDELVFIDGTTKQLRSFNFATNIITTHTAFAVHDVTAGQIDGDAQTELLIALDPGTQMHFFDAVTNTLSAQVGGGGAAGNNVAANFNNNGLTDFAVRNGPNNGSGSLFTLTDPYGGFGSLGGGLNRIATGNLDGNTDPADEVYLTNSGLALFTHGITGPNNFYVQTTGAGTDPAIGHPENFGDGRDLAYIIGTNGQIFQGTTTWNLGIGGTMTYTLLRTIASNDGSAAAAGNTLDFFDIMAADINGDGLDELLGRKTTDGGQGLFLFTNGTSSIILSQANFIPEPATAALLMLGAPMLVRRRRRA